MVVPLWGGIEGWGTKEEVRRSGRRGRGPELCGAAAGGDLGDGRSPGGVKRVECVVELSGGLVVLEGVADLAAGQAGRVGFQGGVDLFGERLAGRAGERPGGGAGGVVVKRERGVEVGRADLSLPVGEGVEEREADRVRLGAGGDLADDSGLGLGELSVGVVPQLAGVVVEAQLASLLGALNGRGELAGQAGVLERVVVAAFGQQSLSSAGDEQEAVAMPTSAW